MTMKRAPYPRRCPAAVRAAPRLVMTVLAVVTSPPRSNDLCRGRLPFSIQNIPHHFCFSVLVIRLKYFLLAHSSWRWSSIMKKRYGCILVMQFLRLIGVARCRSFGCECSRCDLGHGEPTPGSVDPRECEICTPRAAPRMTTRPSNRDHISYQKSSIQARSR